MHPHHHYVLDAMRFAKTKDLITFITNPIVADDIETGVLTMKDLDSGSDDRVIAGLFGNVHR